MNQFIRAFYVSLFSVLAFSAIAQTTNPATQAWVGANFCRLTGCTMTGELVTAASATGTAGLNIPHGTAPTSPVNGDVWTTTSGLLARINGATQTYLFSGGALGTPSSGVGTNITNVNAASLGGKVTGTSGNTIPLLDGANTWSAAQAISNNLTWSWAGASSGSYTIVGNSGGGFAFTNNNNGVGGPFTFTIGAGEAGRIDAGGFKTNVATYMMQSSVAWDNGAAAQTATLTNGPTAGNPTKWIPVNDNGTTRYIPAW